MAEKHLDGKVAIVTGGSMGIGKAIATVFLKEGAQVMLASRNKSDLEMTKQELANLGPRVGILPTDVGDENQVRDLVDFTLTEFGDINILVNCAGIQKPIGFITDIDSEQWLETMKINLFGTFLCIKAVLQTMIKNGRGKIINMSGGGAVAPRPRFSAYSASKAAVVRLTETLAEEVKEYNIDINAIAPGAVNTRLLDEVLQAGEAAGQKALAEAKKQFESGGTPREEAAVLALFLASSKSDGLTGRLISAAWDNWQEIPSSISRIMSSDVYTMRRIIPKDRGYDL